MKTRSARKLPVGMLNKTTRKKTTHCTPREILGRMEEIMIWDGASEREKFRLLEELFNEWRHS